MSKLKEVKFNDGEAADFNDLDRMQRVVRSALFDSVLGSMAWNPNIWSNGTYPGTGLCYAFRAGGMPYYPGGGVTARVNPGLILIAQAANWHTSGTGEDANLAGAYVEPQDLIFAANASGNPRWDVIQARIDPVEGDPETRHFEDAATRVVTSQSMNKRRNMVATISVKQGTPGVSPTEPTPDAGYVKLGAVRLNNGFVSGGQPNDVRDYRVPLGSSVVRIPGHLFSRGEDATLGWSLDASGVFSIQSDASGTDPVYAFPQVGHHARLMKVGLTRKKAAGSTAAVSLVRVNQAGAETPLVTMTSALMVTTGDIYEEYSLASDVPVWSGGYSSWPIQSPGTDVADDQVVALKFVSDGSHQDVIRWAKFFFAGGM